MPHTPLVMAVRAVWTEETRPGVAAESVAGGVSAVAPRRIEASAQHPISCADGGELEI